MPDAELLRGTIMAFDFGLRRIGVAVGQIATGTASSLQTVAHHSKPDWDAITRVVKEWKPDLFVVGLPLSLEGKTTRMSGAAQSFGDHLTERFGLEVRYQDERLSSQEAQSQFAEMRAAGHARRKQSARLDSLAARIILENWLQSTPESPLTAADGSS